MVDSPLAAEGKHCCTFYCSSDISGLRFNPVKKSICAIMNTGKGGVVYFGVDKNGIVKGYRITRSQV